MLREQVATEVVRAQRETQELLAHSREQARRITEEAARRPIDFGSARVPCSMRLAPK